MATVSRKISFNAAHRLFNPSWSEEKNSTVFGKCSYPNFHGHNYVLIVHISGEINNETGYVIDLGELSQLIEEKIISRFDHKNLNLDVVEFANLIPTAENISIVIWEILRKNLDKKHDLKVTLYETERNYVEYEG